MTRGAGHKKNSGGRRLAALALVAAAVAGGAVLGSVAARGGVRAALQPAALAAEAAPSASTSSTWYCPGGPGEDAGTTRLLLANAAGTPVHAEVAVVDQDGTRRSDTLRIGPHGEADVVPGNLVHGPWTASRVVVAAGAVSATELVDGRSGRALLACASETSRRWYFASGSTRAGSTLNVALFNPTPNLAVVDLSFVTASSFTAPSRFQGVVVHPWTMRVLTVGTYVQNQAEVATVVATRSGAVVADELQLFGPGGAGGVAMALGTPSTSRGWDLPSVEDQSGGASALTVFNPSSRSEHVVVGVRLPAGPVEPFSDVLGPRSVWTLATSEEPRIATGLPYTVQVRSGSPGVVVAQTSSGGPHSPSSWWAADVTVSGLETTAADRWIVAGVPVPAQTTASTADTTHAGATHAATTAARTSPSSSASTAELVVENPGRRTVHVRVVSWSRSGTRHVRQLRVPASSRASIAAPAGPAVVQSDGPVALVGDASPAGSAGVVGIPAVPLRRAEPNGERAPGRSGQPG